MPDPRANGGPGGIVLVVGYGHGDQALAGALRERGMRVHTVDGFAAASADVHRLQPDADFLSVVVVSVVPWTSRRVKSSPTPPSRPR